MLKFFQTLFLFVILLVVPTLQETATPTDNTEEELGPPPQPKDISDYLLWGTYKPQLISAITQKSIYPISVGLAFSDLLGQVPSLQEFKDNLRFRMRRDTIAQYSHHNGLDLAVQHVKDPKLGILFDTTLIKDITKAEGQASDIDWIYLVEASKLEDAPEDVLEATATNGFNNFIFIGLGDLEGEGQDHTYLKVLPSEEKDDFLVEIVDVEKQKSKGFMRITVYDQGENIRAVTSCAIDNINKTDTWKVEDAIYEQLTDDTLDETTYLNPSKCSSDGKENITMFLQQTIARPDFKILVSYSSKSIPKHEELDTLQAKIKERQALFEEQYQKIMPVVNVNPYQINITEANEISRYALSNLLGGIQYSYGKIRVLQADGSEPPNKELFTATPSRVGFPRGFLWDEGFHQNLICEWNTTLCITMMRTWFNSIQDDGWIPREQARGDELESNFMQKEFLYQSQQEANPPSMILAILKLVNKIYRQEVEYDDGYEIYLFLGDIYPKLKAWFYWLVKTQQNLDPADGADASLFFKWACKAPCNGKYFASGLDDYPRHPHGYHAVAQLDLHIWLVTFARGIRMIEKTLGVEVDDMDKNHAALLRTLDNFYDPADNLAKDIIGQKHRKENSTKKFRLVNLGYVNLFPLAFGMMRSEESMKATIDLITNREQLWSDFGIRSLSKSDAFFQKGDQYWTEPIWIPLNYLVLRGLKSYYSQVDDAKDLYEALRLNLLENLSATWKKTHNFWENYDSFTGKGKGFPSFTGWTSLFALIYSEKYD